MDETRSATGQPIITGRKRPHHTENHRALSRGHRRKANYDEYYMNQRPKDNLKSAVVVRDRQIAKSLVNGYWLVVLFVTGAFKVKA